MRLQKELIHNQAPCPTLPPFKSGQARSRWHHSNHGDQLSSVTVRACRPGITEQEREYHKEWIMQAVDNQAVLRLAILESHLNQGHSEYSVQGLKQ